VPSNKSSLNFEEVGKMLSSLHVISNKSACQQQCLSACLTYQYYTSVTSAPWPEAALLASLYDTFIYNQSRFGHKFDEYAQLTRYYEDNETAYVDLLQKLAHEGLFQTNFLQLNIQFNASKYTKQKDVAAFLLDAFGVQVGGVLALWLGVTIMIIFKNIGIHRQFSKSVLSSSSYFWQGGRRTPYLNWRNICRSSVLISPVLPLSIIQHQLSLPTPL